MIIFIENYLLLKIDYLNLNINYDKDIMSYSNLSHSLTRQISKEDKKANGIFFTPPKTINHNINLLDFEYLTKNKKIVFETKNNQFFLF